MTRHQHWLKPSSGSELPHSVIYVDTETQESHPNQGVTRHHLWFGWACYERTRASGDWCEPEWFHFRTAVDFWTWAESRARPNTKTYIFAHNWAFDAPVLQTFAILPSRGWVLQRAIIESPPVVLTWRRDSTTLEMLDTLNWWRVPLAKIGVSVGVPKLPFPKRTASDAEWERYGKRDVEIVRTVLRQWWAFLTTHDLGTFARTLAGQSFRTFRHRFLDHPILIDSDARAAILARSAYHGGRTECFRLGKVKGPIYAFDINSAYPAVMATEWYPSVFERRISHASIADLRRWLRDYALVARVRLDTRRPRYAHLHDGKVCFPVGTFEAALTTGDLAEAIEHGEVRGVEEVAVYRKAPIFTRFVEELYRLRVDAQTRGDTVQAWLLKILLNSLYGKFGQRGQVWETIADAPDSAVRVWTEYDVESGRWRDLRQFGGVVQGRMRDEEARDSHPAIAAHVTANTRRSLWQYIIEAGRSNVFYVDTDSLYVNQSGHDRLIRHVHPTDLGKLKLEGVYEWIAIHGPKDYATPKFQRVKGVSGKARWLSPNRIEQEQWSSLAGLLRAGSLDAPTTKRIVKTLRRVYDKGRRGPGGVVLPLRFKDGELVPG